MPDPASFRPPGPSPAIAVAIPESSGGMRLDRALALLLDGHSRGTVRRMIEDGHVCVDGETCRAPRRAMQGGEQVTVDASPGPRPDPEGRPEAIGIEVVAEHKGFLLVNKRPGMVVHPARGHRHGTLLNALLHAYPELASVPRSGIVHRLDKDTSGLLVVARDVRVMSALVRQIGERTLGREYLAIVQGVPPGTGQIGLPLSRDRSNRLRMAVDSRGREALTTYHLKESFGGHSLLVCRLHTGRTHQIRVHLESIGHPIIGDPCYSRHTKRGPDVPWLIGRQALHAWRLSLDHPESGERMSWECGMPDDMREAIRVLKGEEGA